MIQMRLFKAREEDGPSVSDFFYATSPLTVSVELHRQTINIKYHIIFVQFLIEISHFYGSNIFTLHIRYLHN